MHLPLTNSCVIVSISPFGNDFVMVFFVIVSPFRHLVVVVRVELEQRMLFISVSNIESNDDDELKNPNDSSKKLENGSWFLLLRRREVKKSSPNGSELPKNARNKSSGRWKWKNESSKDDDRSSWDVWIFPY